MQHDEALPPDAKEHPLREDRRLLGRLLGEVIKEQAGAEVLERVERIRQTAVRFRRAEADPESTLEAHQVRSDLVAQLDALDIEHTLHVIRAFSYFSHLLNRRYRAGETDERTQRAIHLTINGIAAGLRNTG